MTEAAGLFGYAFAEVNPEFDRDKETKTMNLVIKVSDAPRVYVERIDINGNTNTQDKVVPGPVRGAHEDTIASHLGRRTGDRGDLGDEVSECHLDVRFFGVELLFEVVQDVGQRS